MRTKLIALLLASAGVTATVAACRQGADNPTEQAAVSASGLDLAAMDKSVKPGDDFYAYANGNWMKTTEIPADRSNIGGFYIADQQREKNVRAPLDGILNSNPAAGSDDAKIRDFYNAYLNTDAIDQAGMAPAKADLDAIAAIGDKRALSAAIGSTLRADVDPLNATNFSTDNLFGIFVTQGLSTPGEQIPYILQGGLGMPEREYYLSGDADMAGLRTK